MEYKRRRRRTHKKTESTGGRALLLILILIGAVYLTGKSAVGEWMTKHVAEPVTALFTQHKTDDPPASSDEAKPVSATATGRIELPALECCLLQSGVFSDEENAQEQAREIASMGGAGYVWQDGDRYRVIVSGYSSEREARDVKDALSSQGLECSVHELRSPGTFDVAVTAGTDTTVSSLQTVLFTILSANDDLLDMQKSFDAGQMTAEEGARAAYEIYTALDGCRKDSTSLPKSISGMFDEICASVKDLSESGDLSETEFSAKLKNVQVGIACRFTETVGGLVDIRY